MYATVPSGDLLSCGRSSRRHKTASTALLRLFAQHTNIYTYGINILKQIGLQPPSLFGTAGSSRIPNPYFLIEVIVSLIMGRISARVRVGSRVKLLGMSNLRPSKPCPTPKGEPNPRAALILSCKQGVTCVYNYTRA